MIAELFEFTYAQLEKAQPPLTIPIERGETGLSDHDDRAGVVESFPACNAQWLASKGDIKRLEPTNHGYAVKSPVEI